MIYLDNAATSFPKPELVYKETDVFMRTYCANPGRGAHRMALKSASAVYDTRKALAELFNIENEMNIAFTKNATEAINVAIKGVLKKGDHVITTCMEHNSVLRPLKVMKEKGIIEVSIIHTDTFGRIRMEELRRRIQKNTKMMAITLSSNVTGTLMPVEEIGQMASKLGIIFLLDASQGAGTVDVDAKTLGVDILAFPGHKSLFGFPGTGGLYVDSSIQVDSLMEGGTGSRSNSILQPQIMPDKLESGTLNINGIYSLGKGIEFINSVGLNIIRSKKDSLLRYLFSELEKIDSLKLYSLKENNTGIISFNSYNKDSNEFVALLNEKYDIAVRGGFHCAPLAHKTMGTETSGAVRISVGYFNTVEDIESIISAIREIEA